MKKKRLLRLSVLALAPLALFAGCGGTMTLGFSPNWYFENTVENITGKNETLEYEVSFLPNTIDGITVNYDNGTYVTTLSAENYVQGETSMQVYRYHTQFNIAGRYEKGTERGDMFEDSMTTDVWFTRAAEGLRPIRSAKTVHATVPSTEQNAETFYTAYDFTYELNYAQDLSAADYTLDITAPESKKKTNSGTVKLDVDETVIDNEQITIALRGLNLSSASSTVPFVSIDPQTQKPVTVNLSTEAITTAVAFDCNGETISSSIDAVQVTCSYGSSQPGPQRKFIYAARTDENSKKYRSVLLRFENPVMYSLGTMTYTLKKATFNDR